MKRLLLVLLLLLSSIAESNAQYYTNRNKVWIFGRKAGLDFSSGTPVPVAANIAKAVPYIEGSASVCDTAGHLLFYTDGKDVFNRNHSVMPSGTSIVPFITVSTTQPALITPVIGSPDRFYVFSLEQGGGAGTCHLAYSIVDMTLDGGLGDVVAASAGKPLKDSLSEKMIAIAGTNHNLWVLTHMIDTTLFAAFEITSAGIDTVPVISSTGAFSGPSVQGYARGVIKASHNGRKIVSQCYFGAQGTELYDFDPATGIVSNCLMLDTGSSQYGAEFSPDNTKLYTGQSWGPYYADTTKIHQYNLALTTPAAIRASKTFIAIIPTMLSDLKLGPDRKIYMAGRDDSAVAHGGIYSRYLDCISAPNNAGVACGYLAHAIKLPDTAAIYAGFSNVFVQEDTATTITLSIDPAVAMPGLSVFPNPATTLLTISAAEPVTHLSISNLVGRQVYSGMYNADMVKVDISHLPLGIYFIKVNGTTTKKFIKS